MPLRAITATPPEACPDGFRLADQAQALQPALLADLFNALGSSSERRRLVSCMNTQSAELLANTVASPEFQLLGFTVSNAQRPSGFHQTSARVDCCGTQPCSWIRDTSSWCKPGKRLLQRCLVPVCFLIRLLRALPAREASPVAGMCELGVTELKRHRGVAPAALETAGGMLRQSR